MGQRDDKKITVGIIGASGYTGLELIKLLDTHPRFSLEYVATSSGEGSVESLHPALKGVNSVDVSKADAAEANRLDLVFLALPHKTAFGFAKDLTTKVVDLSADYRLKLEAYEKHYCPHGDKGNLQNYTYGLIEHYREGLRNTRNVAVPGCYPTAALLALLPFMDHIDFDAPVIIDAKSGVSGAGKKCSEKTHFVKANDNMFAYNPLKHRHSCEIAEKLSLAEETVNFVPQIIPATRGMIANCYVQLKHDIDPAQVLGERYGQEPFIRLRETPVEIKNVAGTHYCDLYAAKNGKTLFIASAIDNLLRGASSQALAAANIICGLEEMTGLPRIAYVP